MVAAVREGHYPLACTSTLLPPLTKGIFDLAFPATSESAWDVLTGLTARPVGRDDGRQIHVTPLMGDQAPSFDRYGGHLS